MISIWFLDKQDEEIRTEFIRLRIETRRGLF
jgi:hypothetical protein